MNKYLKTPILLLAALLASCASEDLSMSKGASSPSSGITVLADRQDFTCGDNTRSAYSGLTMSFESGDRIGVYVVNGTTVVSSNVCFTWDGTKWSSATDVGYNAGYDYYAYYPYVASPYTPDFTQTGIKNQFRLFIDDASNKFHQADQTTKAAFNASDLCIAQATHLAPRLIKFSLEHKKGLAVFNGKDAAAATFSGSNLPYTVDSERYFLMPYGTATSFTEDIGGTYALHAAIGKYVTHPIVDVPLTFIALENGTFSFYYTGLSYSLDDGETWTALAANTNTPTVTAGNKIMWKNNREMTASSGNIGIGWFSSTGRFDVEGNIMSLHYGDDFAGRKDISSKNCAFSALFNNSKVVNANRLILPTTLSENCFSNMFSGCSYLISPPKLLASTLINSCYSNMFRSCTALTTAPELPATELDANCYSSMFSGCTALTTAPELPATTIAARCYKYMFYDCTALVNVPTILPATTLYQECYQNMFGRCTSLTTAPELPALELVESCYYHMFDGCSNLNYVKAAFTTAPNGDYGYTGQWLKGVAATGTFYKNSAAEWTYNGISGVPSGWTVETYTP